MSRRHHTRDDASTVTKESVNVNPAGTTGRPSRHLATRLALLAALATAAFLLLAGSAVAQPSEHPFEIEPGTFHIVPSTTQAAAHEDLTTEFDFAHEGSKTDNDVRTTIVELPPGFIGSNTAVPTCTPAQLVGNPGFGTSMNGTECPIASQVGQISIECTGCVTAQPILETVTVPVFNIEVTSFGVAAELGFNVGGAIVQILPVTVRPGDSGLTVTSPNIEKTSEAHHVVFTVWGLPASHAHDAQRGLFCASGFTPECATKVGAHLEEPVHPVAAGIPVRPFLSNPTSCEPHLAILKSNSWEEPGFSAAQTEVGPIDGCERVPFRPEIEARPTTNSAETSTGLDTSLLIPQAWSNPVTLSTAHLDDAVVTLPAGMSLNPSAGSGLGYCTEAQLAEEAFDSPPTVGCPSESEVGTVEVETPVLTEKAKGSVYVAQPFHNPFNSLLALYIVAKIPSRGVIVKVAGKVTPDPVTGQLVTTFNENPQVPFSKFTLSFRQGATSPLVSPPVCGKYTAEADLSPWSAPLSPRHLLSEFQIEHGIGGGPCPSGATPPFHPGLLAGTINNRAGSYSPFYLRLSRNDGEQEITHFSIKLPPGVSGKLAGIPECSDQAIAQAKAREHDQGGAEEEASPSCPAASEVGHSLVEAGVGSVLAQAPGKMYLAGPYHGSNLSLVSITAAKVGPFDLGTVVVRFALKIDPETAEVSVDGATSDPIPHIVDGIPTHLRTIRAYVDRPSFSLNPTNCEPTSTASTVLGSGKDFVSEADDVPITVTSPFQAADCAALGFKPALKLSLKGSTKRGGTPAFKAVLHARPGDANIGEAQVTLPHSEFLEQAHIGTVCTRVQFKEGTVPGEKCPAASVYGRARAVTPILAEPLEGPVYLRSSSHNLPDLVAALNNKQVDIALDGHIDSVEGGRIRNTFEAVPDAPVTKFTLEMKGGKKGLLVNSTNICKSTNRAISHFTGQNGKVYDTKPVLKAPCAGKAKKKGHKKGAKAKKGAKKSASVVGESHR